MLGAYNPFNYNKMYSATNKPFFEVYAEKGFSPDKLQQFGDDMKVPNKVVKMIKGVNHFDLYYKPEHVDPIVIDIVDFVNGAMKQD